MVFLWSGLSVESRDEPRAPLPQLRSAKENATELTKSVAQICAGGAFPIYSLPLEMRASRRAPMVMVSIACAIVWFIFDTIRQVLVRRVSVSYGSRLSSYCVQCLI